jgi:hypothetical protein
LRGSRAVVPVVSNQGLGPLQRTGARSSDPVVDRLVGKPEPLVANGTRVQMLRTGDQYIVANVHQTPHGPRATLVRATPKPKGKAARKAARAERRRTRGWRE